MGKPPSSDKNELKKGPWTAEEDEKLLDYIQKHGHGGWRTLPKNAGLKRCGKSCRLRWTNYLRPDIKRGKFSFEEEEAILQLHSVLGNKWSAIATRLPGRTDNEIKNYWNTHIKKKLLRMGIDPVTHKPRLDLLHLYSLLNPSLLGIGPLLAQNNQKPSTSFFPCQAQNQSPQFFQENTPPNQILNDTHLMNIANLDQLLPSNNDLSNFGLQSSWDGNNNGNMGENSLVPNLAYHRNDHSSTISPFENLPSLMSFNTIFSTPSSYSSTPSSYNSTPLHSSPTTYVNGGTEKRDGYCNNRCFDLPNSLNSNIM